MGMDMDINRRDQPSAGQASTDNRPIPLLATVKMWLIGLAFFAFLQLLQTQGWDIYFRRSNIVDGEIWRVLMGHFVHLNSMHLFLNWLGFGLALLLFPSLLQWRYLLVSSVIGALAISAGLYYFLLSLEWYCGFSGVLQTLLVVGSLLHWKEPVGKLVLAIVSMKTIYEITGGSVSGQLTDELDNVVYQAHWLGYAIGLPVGWYFYTRQSTSEH